MFYVHLTPKSNNAKTGPIPVSTSTKSSCPDTCPFASSNQGGCYAGNGPLNIHWNKITGGERGTDWESFCDKIEALPEGQLWRHNQAGDLPHNDGVIDTSMLAMLVHANTGKGGFTYTHHDIDNQDNLDAVEWANNHGFTINVSANGPGHASELKSKVDGIPVVSVVPTGFWDDSDRNVKHSDGAVFVRCPAEYRKDVSCATCGACAVTGRNSVIAFTAHGTQKKKASIIARG